jgi:hypothetical protein
VKSIVEAICMAKADKERLSGMVEICDDQNRVNKILLEKGFLSMTSVEETEMRYIPWQEGDWINLACIAHNSRVIMRLPVSLGDRAKMFFLGFMGHQAMQYSNDGVLTVGSHDTTGAAN